MKKSFIIFFVFICLINMTACSFEKASDNYNYLSKEEYYNDSSYGYLPSDSDSETVTSENDYVYSERKLITTIDMTVETKEFDKFIKDLNDLISQNGGYSEKFNLTQSNYRTSKTASFVIRIPSENLSVFLDGTKIMVNVLLYSEKTDDVSLQYADIEGRLTALKAEQIALTKMLENATGVSDCIEIQKRLSSVSGEIESYESQLRILSSKIAYSTVNLTVNEVLELTVENDDISFWEELTEKFKSSFDETILYLRNMFVDILGGIPYILAIIVTIIVALIIPFIIVLIIILSIKRKKKKKLAKQIPINTVANINNDTSKQ